MTGKITTLRPEGSAPALPDVDAVEFDLQSMTAAAYPVFTGGMTERVTVLAQVVTRCPEAWGNPSKVDTWQRLPLKDSMWVLNQLKERRLQLAQQSDLTGWVFNCDMIDALDYDTLLKQINDVNPRVIAPLMVKYLAGVPVDFQSGGKVTTERLLTLPMYTLFIQLTDMLAQEAQAATLGFLGAITTPS